MQNRGASRPLGYQLKLATSVIGPTGRVALLDVADPAFRLGLGDGAHGALGGAVDAGGGRGVHALATRNAAAGSTLHPCDASDG